jgi:hypothetical protein
MSSRWVEWVDMDAAVIVLLLVVARSRSPRDAGRGEIPVEQLGPPVGNRITDDGLAA